MIGERQQIQTRPPEATASTVDPCPSMFNLKNCAVCRLCFSLLLYDIVPCDCAFLFVQCF